MKSRSKLLTRALGLLGAVPLLLLSLRAVAGPTLVPPPLRSAIIVKSAAYERSFAERSGKAVLAVVLDSTNETREDGRVMAAALQKILEKTKIAQRATQVVEVTRDPDPTKTAEKIRAAHAEIVYLSAGLEGLAGEIPTQDDMRRIIVVCSHGSQLDRGCVLGVELDGTTPRLVLNLKRASEVGLRFQPDLLRLARVVR
ncbi:MAG: YfiR family protein [Polyangiaceae bacterium]|nr:YfiR family protein [Polyangiaceae bacterium]